MKTYPESRLTDLLIEFDEMGFCPTTACPNPEQTAIEWKEQIVKEIQKLQAEKAELRARLDKAVELPTIYEHISYPYVERMYSETIYYVIYKENGRIMTEKFGKNKSKAEARLKEIKEKSND